MINKRDIKNIHLCYTIIEKLKGTKDMKWLEKIKSFFQKLKFKRLSEASDNSKVVYLIKKEKDISKIQSMLSNYATILAPHEIIDIISKVPLKKRLEFLIMYKKYITSYEICDFIIKRLDTTFKIKALKEFCDELDLYDIYRIFDNISPDRRAEALDNSIDRFDSYSIAEIIQEYIPLMERKEVLYKYEHLIDSISKANTILKMHPDDILDSLERYKTELTKTSIMEVIKKLPSSKMYEALTIVSDRLSNIQISNLITYNIPETERRKSLLENADKLESALISDIIKYALCYEEQKKAIIELKDKLNETHIAEIIQYYLHDDKELIEKLKDKMYEEDVLYFENKNIG